MSGAKSPILDECDNAHRRVRTTLGLQFADLAVALAGAIEDQAILGDLGSRRREQAATPAQFLPPGTNAEVAFRIVGEVAARKSSVRALRLVEHLHMRLDLALVGQPPEHLGRAVRRRRPSATG